MPCRHGNGQMKIIAFDRMYGQPVGDIMEALESDAVPSPAGFAAVSATDSACVRVGQPLFLPDFAADWKIEVCPCWHIGRLGKSLPPEFVECHIAGMGVICRLMPPGGEPVSGGGLSANFDGAFAPSATMPFGGFGDMELSVTTSAATECIAPKILKKETLAAAETIALASRWMILKTGDIMVPCLSGLSVDAVIGTDITVRLNGLETLNLRIR